MSKPVSLNRFRKAAKKAAKKRLADENSLRFGQAKSNRIGDRTRRENAEKHLDQHRLDKDR